MQFFITTSRAQSSSGTSVHGGRNGGRFSFFHTLFPRAGVLTWSLVKVQLHFLFGSAHCNGIGTQIAISFVTRKRMLIT